MTKANKGLRQELETAIVNRDKARVLYNLWHHRYGLIAELELQHGTKIWEPAIAQQYAYAAINTVRTEYTYDGIGMIKVHFPAYTAFVKAS